MEPVKKASSLRALQEAQAAGDAAALAAAIPVAEAAQVDADEVAKAKKALFKLQKEKREKGKLERAKSTAAAELAVAVAGDSAEALRQAMQKAEEVGVSKGLDEAKTRLVTLEEEEKRECIKLAFEDLEYAISQEDAEAAQLALEDAAGMGASEEELRVGEERISALRLKLDPEGEARRKRVEARKAKAGEKKWNFSGKSDNRIINDRFREHEAELERQRMLAFRARGRFKAEDEGEEGAEKGIKKLRAEVSKEFGAVPLPKLNEASSGFAWGRVAKEEGEAPRHITLRAHVEAGAGIDLHASWWGMVVDGIDPEPGQPGLRLKDSLVEINGTSLIELPDEDCEQRFADLFGDGCTVKVEPHVQVSGILAPPAPVDKTSLEADLERFSADWGVVLRVEEAGGNSMRILLEGAQSAVRQSKPELQNLMGFYAQAKSA
ncbi:hypothetical protein AK812_SmicGene16471 [Symbiodinium microadriaticum]|uniref:PDZ domain-containing protein n=1 Tax=Symbiodinium microadriaticum TaxID=2951 RepID=A0A1Q9E083_SYMMI|nr:hypothetical protein AK812_SmicGene16471 [Symbiodinium microadriaticum]